MDASMTVIGAGSYGTALAIALSRNGQNIVLWGHNPQHIFTLQANRRHIIFFPDVLFPDSLSLESDLSIALAASKNVLIVVPSYAFRKILKQIKSLMRRDTRVVWATKGLEAKTGRLLQDVAYEVLGNNTSLAVISGPAFAKEIAKGMPTAISLASNDEMFAEDLQMLLHNSNNLFVYGNSDFIGVQLVGAVKNVIAIGVGISDGIGFGANTRIALLTRGFAEMSRLGEAIGANPATFVGMAGLGDLVLTCTDNQSRNRRFGILLGQGINVKKALEKICQVVEGYYNAKEVRELSRRLFVEMPIIEEIYQILYCGKSIMEASETLLSRARKFEYE